MDLEWIPTGDVRIGDRLACLLSDARSYPTVTGWSDKMLILSRYGLDDVTHRTFTVTGASWWTEDMLTFNLAEGTLIVKRGA